ncbi:isopentenyl phosphate kinase [Fortiea contorta]|uniref:isopentenyl phosphate kinase n=1 Tax=Fortiea contorta TaxID=1892405 RepID=UPI001EE65AD9|nr:isopentenyl phosphate kinase [Fortiea contorta]
MMELALIKLGGSLITDKDKPYTPRLEIMQQLAWEVQQIRKQNPHLKLIIGNGAGSFAHQSAKKHNTIEGVFNDADKLGFCLVHQDALELNLLLAKVFLKTGLPVVSLPPLMMVVTQNQQLLKTDFAYIENTLASGMIPLVFGDVVLDQAIGGTIVSSDTLLGELAKYFHRQELQVRLINAGNYPGVCKQNGQVISHITPVNYGQIKTFLGQSESIDVTGGMAKKVAEFLTVASLGIDCWIIDGNIPGNLSRTVLGQSCLGTLISS